MLYILFYYYYYYLKWEFYFLTTQLPFEFRSLLEGHLLRHLPVAGLSSLPEGHIFIFFVFILDDFLVLDLDVRLLFFVLTTQLLFEFRSLCEGHLFRHRLVAGLSSFPSGHCFT